jgi:hypothetical protein
MLVSESLARGEVWYEASDAALAEVAATTGLDLEEMRPGMAMQGLEAQRKRGWGGCWETGRGERRWSEWCTGEMSGRDVSLRCELCASEGGGRGARSSLSFRCVYLCSSNRSVVIVVVASIQSS